MFQSVTYQIFQSKQKSNLIITACILLFIFTNVLLDYSFTQFQNSAFYISESLLFSSYWVLFLPLLTAVLKLTKKSENLMIRLLVISAAIVLHLFSYPILVWIISKVFYYHTFSYWQTFNFGLSAYFIKTVIIYGVSLLVVVLWNRKSQSLPLKEKVDGQTNEQNFIRSILISDRNNKKQLLEVKDILYFAANSPYVTIYHSSKKYLHAETLRSLETQLDGKQFVRIHKSHIVNIDKISAIQSRQNGDYDITLLEHTTLRVSRSYAKNFKSKFSEHNQLALK
ncbi:LytR/AlgR family response regulator transcription factor [Flavobacterium sp. N502536]|uniref:LytR/AlgR family response regulator transcription factor n=1 Tax=Flavobacterium sp. N502536 TaxID=2986837 RepID=UPI0022222124|nr:LytTR family DNA-binding domain-containing protein [Flavobacterium sp. N502536]